MLTPEEILAFEKTFTDKKTYRRFLCIKLHVIDQKPQADIATQTGYNLRHVQRLHAQVRTHGLESLLPKTGIARRRLLPSLEAEQALLEQHKGKVGIHDLHQALNDLAGREVYPQTVYRLLSRHGFKGKMPRPVHPDQAVEAQEAFKKNP
jgi:transposase